ncbi:MAG: lipoprotein NlpI [bacterium ADurb.Bin236]|nr:MAG: lipoprotein NlpI [bacterium ADurb.Bin236]HPN94614.1 hypothetical protein [bacterium]
MMNFLRQIKSLAVAAAVTALIASFALADTPEYSIGSSWDKYFGLFYKGASHGIKTEQNFEVWRDGKKIGIFTVRQLSDTVSKGIFTPDAPDEILKDGDKLRPAAATVQGPSPAAGTTKDDKAPPPKAESAPITEKKADATTVKVEPPQPAAEAKQEPKPAAATVKTEEKAVPAKKTETQPAAVVEKKTETKPAATSSKQENTSTAPVDVVAPKETSQKKAEEVKKETPKEPEKAAPAQPAVEKPNVVVAEKPAAAAAPASDSSVTADTGEKHETTSARRERVVALKKVEEEDSVAPVAQQKTETAPAASSAPSKLTPEKTAEAEKTKVAAKPAAVVETTAETEQKTQETADKAKTEEVPAPAKEVKPAEPAPAADRKSKKAEKPEEKPVASSDKKKPEPAPVALEKKAEPKPPAPAQPPQDEPKKAEKQLKDILPKTDAPPEGGEWTAERHVYKANSFFIDRSYHRALEHYAAALAIDPANEYARKGVVESSKKLGIVHPLADTSAPEERSAARKQDDSKKTSATYFTKEDDPLLDNSGTYNNFGVYLIKQNEYAQAVEWLDKAIARNANVPLYYRNRAVANYRLGNILDAVHDAKKAMDLGDERAKEMLKTLRGLIQAGQNADN